MAESVELYLALTGIVVGLSHVMRARDWADAYRLIYRCGRAGAFLNGGFSLAAGSLIVAGHPAWTFPGGVLTGLGWLMVVKGVISLLAPEKALVSIGRGAESPRGFVAAGLACILIGIWAGYCVWCRHYVGATEL